VGADSVMVGVDNPCIQFVIFYIKHIKRRTPPPCSYVNFVVT
jgi:hypothetical protein